MAETRALSHDGRVWATALNGFFDPMFTLTDRVNGLTEDVKRGGVSVGALVPSVSLDESGRTVVFASNQDLLDPTEFGGQLWLYDRDMDDDLMPDQWETLFGFDINGPGDAGLDSDSDGVSNLAEYPARHAPEGDRGQHALLRGRRGQCILLDANRDAQSERGADDRGRIASSARTARPRRSRVRSRRSRGRRWS